VAKEAAERAFSDDIKLLTTYNLEQLRKASLRSQEDGAGSSSSLSGGVSLIACSGTRRDVLTALGLTLNRNSKLCLSFGDVVQVV
jgi:hypothetical protein